MKLMNPLLLTSYVGLMFVAVGPCRPAPVYCPAPPGWYGEWHQHASVCVDVCSPLLTCCLSFSPSHRDWQSVPSSHRVRCPTFFHIVHIFLSSWVGKINVNAVLIFKLRLLPSWPSTPSPPELHHLSQFISSNLLRLRCLLIISHIP